MRTTKQLMKEPYNHIKVTPKTRMNIKTMHTFKCRSSSSINAQRPSPKAQPQLSCSASLPAFPVHRAPRHVVLGRWKVPELLSLTVYSTVHLPLERIHSTPECLEGALLECRPYPSFPLFPLSEKLRIPSRPVPRMLDPAGTGSFTTTHVISA